jgi:hypothetical protein
MTCEKSKRFICFSEMKKVTRTDIVRRQNVLQKGIRENIVMRIRGVEKVGLEEAGNFILLFN